MDDSLVLVITDVGVDAWPAGYSWSDGSQGKLDGSVSIMGQHRLV